jgi:hypothetical protein
LLSLKLLSGSSPSSMKRDNISCLICSLHNKKTNGDEIEF